MTRCICEFDLGLGALSTCPQHGTPPSQSGSQTAPSTWWACGRCSTTATVVYHCGDRCPAIEVERCRECGQPLQQPSQPRS